jgi:hypothetical protein
MRIYHSVWLTKNKLVHLPLVKAMARVIGAERNLVGGHSSLNATQMADIQSINEILSNTGQVVEGFKAAEQALTFQRQALRNILVGEREATEGPE